MIFGRKNYPKCKNCNSEIIKKDFSFCPYCGYSLLDPAKEMKEFGVLGRDDIRNKKTTQNENNLPISMTDTLISNMLNHVMKSLDKQIKGIAEQNINDISNADASIEQLPNGIKISIGMPKVGQPKQKSNSKKQITPEQMDKLSKLPRKEAKSKIKRIGDKLYYEISASGITNPEDVLISKLESGYEVKAIAKKKVYVNSVPVNLPLRGFSFDEKSLVLEFKQQK